MGAEKNVESRKRFFDMQAAIGITKHIGGFEATDELLSLCHIENAREVLNVGCGIGIGSAYVAKKHGCRVVGVDITEKMVEWSRLRARQEKVEDKVEVRIGDVLGLPFEDDRFDVVFCESVLVFVEDKARAIRECVRVTKPGGYVGFNEAFWFTKPSPDVEARVASALGPSIPTLEGWRRLWAESGLQERVEKTFSIDAKAEVKSRIRWIGWPWLIKAWGRALRLYITNPDVRQSIKKTFEVDAGVFMSCGYGLFAGKK